MNALTLVIRSSPTLVAPSEMLVYRTEPALRISLSLQKGASTYWFLVQYQLVGNRDGEEYDQGLANEMTPFSLTFNKINTQLK